jgi:hypothetical protein
VCWHGLTGTPSPPQSPRQLAARPPAGYLNLHGELPGLAGSLRSLLQRILNRRLVEPNRRYLDVQRIWRNKYVARVRLRAARRGPAHSLAPVRCLQCASRVWRMWVHWFSVMQCSVMQ